MIPGGCVPVLGWCGWSFPLARSQSFPLSVVSPLVMVLSAYAIVRVSSIGVVVVCHDDSGQKK